MAAVHRGLVYSRRGLDLGGGVCSAVVVCVVAAIHRGLAVSRLGLDLGPVSSAVQAWCAQPYAEVCVLLGPRRVASCLYGWDHLRYGKPDFPPLLFFRLQVGRGNAGRGYT